MTYNRTSFRNFLTRHLAAMALLCIYTLGILGASALLLEATSTSAFARGGFHGGGFHGGGFHGFHGGYGLGYYPYPYPYPYGYYGGYYPDEGDAGVCYSVRQRVRTRYGWRIRRVSVCE